MNKCDPNAFCTNTQGSYNCSCNPTYIEDGLRCKGAFAIYHAIKSVMVAIAYTRSKSFHTQAAVGGHIAACFHVNYVSCTLVRRKLFFNAGYLVLTTGLKT